MLIPTILTVLTLARSASCSPVSAADSSAPSPNNPAPSSPAPNDLATLDILGSGVRQTSLGKRNDDAALRSNARKRGVAWQLGSSGTLAPFNTLATYYTYGPNAYNTSENGPAFVPQLWGCSDAHVDEFQARMGAECAIAGSDQKARLLKNKELLTFNEPNEAGQANCSPAVAAAVWKKVIEPLRGQGWRVGSPAVNTGGWGMSWMLDFWRECNGSCHPDFLAVHFYNPSSASLPSALTQWHTTFNLPVQVTEIAPMSWPPRGDEHVDSTQVRNYMQSVTAWMDGTEWVERYYWYGAKWDMGSLNPELALLKDSQTLSPLGQLYVSSQSPQYAWSLQENGGVAALASPVLLTGLLVAAIVFV